jgi:hypothetical protein
VSVFAVFFTERYICAWFSDDVFVFRYDVLRVVLASD